jgi:PAS domain S-box-containing protein
MAFLDITERKQAEEAYRTLVDNSLQALVIFQDGRNVFANPAAAHITGYTQEELLAMSPEEANQVVYPDDRVLLAERARQRQQGQDVPSCYEFRLIRKDGAVRWVECFNVRTLYRGSPAVQMTYIDITERKEAEEAYTLLVEHSLQALQIFQDGRIVFTNAAAMHITGYSQEEMLALSPDAWPLYIHPDDREAIVQRSRDRLTGTPPSRYAYRFIRKDGAVRWIEQMVTSITYRGRPATYMTYIDITERKEAEEALRTLSRAIEQSTVSVVITDADGTIVYVNPFFTQTTGYTQAEAIGQNPRILKSGYTSPELYQAMWQRISSGQKWNGVFHNRKKNGDLYWEDATIAPVYDANGAITHYVAVKEDITQRKKIEEALRQSEARLQHVLRSSPVIIFTSQASGEYGATFVSDNVRRVLGYEPGEFTEQSDFWASHIHPDDAPTIFANLPQLFEHNEHEHVYRFLHRDGTYRWMYNVMRLIRDASGIPVEIIGTLEDITERKEAEEALRASEQRLQAIFDNAAVGIGLTDKTGRSILANARGATQLGYTPEELAQLSNLELTHPDDRAETVEHMQQLVRGEIQGYRIEKRYLRKDGSIFWADLSVSVVYDDDGAIAYILGIVVDITERKQLEHQLHQANMLLQEQAIRDPLTGLHNRRYLDETLPRELQRAERAGQPVGIIMLDIDHFKRINDTYGHDAGDTVLREVGAFLKEHTRGADIACRYKVDPMSSTTR